MSRTTVVAAFMLAITILARLGGAQQIPTSSQQAEHEGNGFRRAPIPPRNAQVFDKPFRGSAQRRCVDPTSPRGLEINESILEPLRSGELIVRYGALNAGVSAKILWMPLHNPNDYPDTLLIRAVRLGDVGDSLRVTVSDWGWHASRVNSGYPSNVTFDSAGTWLVVATAGNDWGCFLLPVSG